MLSLQLQKRLLKKITLTVVEMQQLPDIEKKESKKKFCLKRTKYIGRRKVCVNFKTDTDNLNVDVCRYRNPLYLKDKKTDLVLTQL